MLGDNYFKSWDINFTNKSLKENSNALMTMRLEKENEFIDLEFVKGTETFILLSKTDNQIFVFEKKVLVNHLVNYKDQEEKSDGSDNDSFADNIDFSEEDQISEVQNRKGKARFSQANNEKKRKMRGHDASIMDRIGSVKFMNSNVRLFRLISP